MKGLCGLVPALGFASINGTALLGMSPAIRARMIGYVAQDLAHLDVRLSTYELLLLAQQGSARSWKTSAEARYKAAELLELLGLQRFAESQPGRLSGANDR